MKSLFLYAFVALVTLIVGVNVLNKASLFFRKYISLSEFLVSSGVLLALGVVAVLTARYLSTLDSTNFIGSVGTFVRQHKLWIIFCCVFAFGGSFILLGLPGAAILEVLELLVEPLIARPLGWPRPQGDAVWPVAIGYTFFAP